jgi:hypothetical protein
MNSADSTPLVPSLKLFPRLATTRRPHRPARTARGLLSKSTDRVDSREELRSQVRARLLRMILDNEQVRRNEQRPSAR